MVLKTISFYITPTIEKTKHDLYNLQMTKKKKKKFWLDYFINVSCNSVLFVCKYTSVQKN